MSLSTLLHIGHILNPDNNSQRTNSNQISNFRFLSSPQQHEHSYWFSVDMHSDYSIDWTTFKIIPEKQKQHLCYFKSKTSDQDSSTPTYIFGDISIVKKGKEGKKDSLELFKDTIKECKKNSIVGYLFKKKKTRDSVKKYLTDKDDGNTLADVLCQHPIICFWRQIYRDSDTIRRYIDNAPAEDAKLNNNIENKDKEGENKGKKKKGTGKSAEYHVFLHFEFKGSETGSNWYEQEKCCKDIFNYMKSKITSKTENGIVMDKSIYPTVCSGEEKNDIQVPGFSLANRYKAFSFKDDMQLNDFLYADGVRHQYKKTIWGTNMKILILPWSIGSAKGKDALSQKNLESFFYNNKSESNLFSTEICDCFTENEQESILFDYVFVDAGGNTDNYLLEISGLQNSQLKHIEERLNEITNRVSDIVKKDMSWDTFNIKPESAITTIIGMPEMNEEGEISFSNQVTRNGKKVPNPKYESHILFVIPRIYTESYYTDRILLPTTIKQIEYCVRNHKSAAVGDKYYNYLHSGYARLKYSLMFLMNIQNNENNEYMEITNSPCYQVGKELGSIARPLGRKINSFQKNYVGMLTRRASSKEDCIALANDIIEKLVMHDCSYQTTLVSKVYEEIAGLKDFDREFFTFGFFEGYFKYVASESVDKFIERAEKLVSDFADNEAVAEAIRSIQELIETLKNK